MALLTQDLKFTVAPKTCDDGDCIEVQISGEQNAKFFLSPQQARAIASDLIQTVYRAEVKNSLQGKQPRAAVSKTDAVGEKYSLHTPHAV